MLLATTCFCQTIEVTAQWTAPTTGSAVVQYELQINEDGGEFYTIGFTENTSFVMQAENLITYKARVRGIDKLDRAGNWSEESENYMADAGIPGAPSKPIVLE